MSVSICLSLFALLASEMAIFFHGNSDKWELYLAMGDAAALFLVTFGSFNAVRNFFSVHHPIMVFFFTDLAFIHTSVFALPKGRTFCHLRSVWSRAILCASGSFGIFVFPWMTGPMDNGDGTDENNDDANNREEDAGRHPNIDQHIHTIREKMKIKKIERGKLILASPDPSLSTLDRPLFSDSEPNHLLCDILTRFYNFDRNVLIYDYRTLISTVESLGFAHGFNFSKELAICESEGDTGAMDEGDESESHDRIATRYDDLDLFTDVKFKTFTPSFQPKRIQYKLQPNRPSVSDESVSDENTTAVSNTSSKDDNMVNGDFDFDYDPVRDAKLVAKNANKLMKNDQQIMKYWFQRYRLFSKLNDGVLMDREGWFSVTPERIAEHIADRMARENGSIVLDAFTGVGGNAIQFALRGAHVYAIDIDPVRLRCAARNSEIYGVSKQITFICGHFFDIAKSFFGSRGLAQVADSSGDYGRVNIYGISSVFLSPPWGGPSYHNSKVFDLELHVEPNGKVIYDVSRRISLNICYFLPRNTSVDQLISLAGPGGKVEVEQNILNGKIKTLCAYYGNLIAK